MYNVGILGKLPSATIPWSGALRHHYRSAGCRSPTMSAQPDTQASKSTEQRHKADNVQATAVPHSARPGPPRAHLPRPARARSAHVPDRLLTARPRITLCWDRGTGRPLHLAQLANRPCSAPSLPLSPALGMRALSPPRRSTRARPYAWLCARPLRSSQPLHPAHEKPW